jgi:hypothetical protein
MGSFLKKNDDLKNAVHEVLVFLDIFDYPPTAMEVWRLSGFKTDLQSVMDCLSADKVGKRNGFYFLPDREELVTKRSSFFHLAERKYRIARRAADILKFVPGIKMVAVCNNFYYKEGSDVDFFVITAKDRLYLARFLVTAVLHIFGLRRHGVKVADRICLSFYVAEDNLNLESLTLKPCDPYFYHWLAFLQPIYGRSSYRDFWSANAWLKAYMPNAWPNDINAVKAVEDSPLSSAFKRFLSWFLGGRFGDALEAIMKKLQMRRMSKRPSGPGVVVGDRVLKFHENDRRAEFRERLKERMNV